MSTAPGRIKWLAGGIAALVLAGILIHQRTRSDRNQGEAGGPVPKPEISGRTGERVPMPRRNAAAPSLSRLPDLPPAIQSPHPIGSPENQDWITKRIDELAALAWEDDPESLGKILAELRNPLPEIRTAALEAIRNFDSRDAIPYLEAIARDTADPLEQKNLTDTVERLRLPTLVEHLDSPSNSENGSNTNR